MRFALIDNLRIEAKPGLKGLCPGCSQVVLTKCGVQRINHWAHVSNKACDSWSESETEWHRSWKNHFPAEWQEVILHDPLTGENHIADVRTDRGLVIEFQHSNIVPHERISREKFHKNMVWVVDGTRLKGDYPRFLKGRTNFHSVKNGVFRVSFPDECFPLAWPECSTPVIFDFRGNERIEDPNDARNDVYCLFPKRIGRDAILAVLSRKAFIDATTNGNFLLWTRNLMEIISQVDKEWQDQEARRKRYQDNINFERFSRAVRNRKNRRF